MTKNQAIQCIAHTSSGTVAKIIGRSKYEAIDAAVNDWILSAASSPDDIFWWCESIWDVVDVLG